MTFFPLSNDDRGKLQRLNKQPDVVFALKKLFLNVATKGTLPDNTPEEYLRAWGIKLEIIANTYETDENGLYTGRVSPSEKSQILFPDSPLITSEKLEKYSIGNRRRIIIIDNEEYNIYRNNGLPGNIRIINIQDEISQKEIDNAIKFILS